MTTDLTKGSPFKQILLFSIPYLIGILFQQFYNIADMVIVGRTLDINAYTAVGATGGLIWFASGAIQSLTVGFSAVTARYFGSQDEEKVKQSFASGIKLSAIISIPMTVLCMIFARPMLELLRTPADIIDRSYSYLIWIFAGLIATAMFNLLSNVIRSLGDSKTPLYFLIIACVINIILDFVFIVLCGMDTDGAGLATVLAQLISGLLCIGYIVKKQPRLHVSRRHFKTDRALNSLMLKIGVPMAFQNMVISIGGICIQFVTNGLGTVYVSSQATGTKIETFVTQPILSFGSAASVFVAQNYGAGKPSRVIEGSRQTLLITFSWCAIACAIMIPFGKLIVGLLTGSDVSPEIVDNAYRYIIVNTALSFVVAPLIVYKSVLQAIGRTVWPMISGFTEIIGRAGVALVVMYIVEKAILSGSASYTVMCFATPAAWIFGFLTVLPDYIVTARKLRKTPDSTELPENI